MPGHNSCSSGIIPPRSSLSYICTFNCPIAALPIPQQASILISMFCQTFNDPYCHSSTSFLKEDFKKIPHTNTTIQSYVVTVCVCLCVGMCERDNVLTLERLPGSLHELLDGIAGQVSSGMLSLTVGTRIQTPRHTETER